MRTFRIALVAAGLLILVLDYFGIEEFSRSPYHGLQHNNLVFLQFDEESPNRGTGLLPGDRITGVDGTPVRNITHFKHIINSEDADKDRVFSISRGDSSFEASIVSVAQPRGKIYRKIAMSITALTFMVVGFYVILKRPDILGVLFTVNCLIFSFLLTDRPSTSLPMLHVLGEIFYDGLFAFLPAFFLHFFLIFPGKELDRGSRRSMAGKLLYLPSTAIFISMFVLALVNYSREIPASLLLLFNGVASVYWVLYMVGGVALFIRTYMTSDKAQKVKFRIATIGLVAGTIPVTVVMMLKQFAPSLDIPFDHVSMIFLSFISISFAYSILKHDAFDIRAVFSTGLAYVVVPVFLTTLVYLFNRGMLRKFPGSLDIRHMTMMVTAVMLA
ncbi:MAG TPA: hypothetical protein VLA34_06145, partial [Candidatus Krumholzibacterium sp.]|nr:hypothetical protein [Candidatus Krumholzibacterium sp.]